MSYRIEFERRAAKQYKGLDPPVGEKVEEKILALQRDPYKHRLLSKSFSGLRRIVIGTSGGQHRVVYAIDEELKAVVIVFVGSRANFYKELQRYLG